MKKQTWLVLTMLLVTIPTGLAMAMEFRTLGFNRPKTTTPFQPDYWNTGAKEIFGDASWIARNGVFPVVFMVKDASQNPVCNMVVKTYRRIGGSRFLIETISVGDISFDQFYLFGSYGFASLPGGAPAVGDTVLFEWEATYNDNLLCAASHTSRYFNRITVGQALPAIANMYRTDTHYHTRFTDNIFEFGGFMWMVRFAAEVIGLQAVCITDHSTDIRTSANEFGWNQLLAEADSLGDELVMLIPGEELTVDSNESNEFPDNRIHLLAIGLTRPLLAPEECCSQNTSTQLWTLRQGLDSVAVQSAVTIAAHPSVNFSVGYGGQLTTWSSTNFDIASTYNDFAGSEFYNERKTVLNNPVENDDHVYDYDWTPDPNWEASWNQGLTDFFGLIKRNLSPVRPFGLYGGSDAHGDFSRKYTNQYGITGRVTNDNAIGKVHTLVYSPSGLNQAGITGGLRNRQTVMTDGPAFTVWADPNGDNIADGTIGGLYAFGLNAKLRLEGGSLSGEHGPFTQARVYRVKPTGVDTTIVGLSGTALNLTLTASQYPIPGSWCALIINVRTQKGYQATSSPIYLAPQGTTAVGPDVSTIQFSVHPNPGRSVNFGVSLCERACAKIELYDVRGRFIETVLAGCEQTSYHRLLTGHSIDSGIYFARLLVNGRQVNVRRVVIFN